MTTYLYETLPVRDGDVVKLCEIQQGTNAEALTKHPGTGEPIRRVILGGWGSKKGAAKIESSGGDCGCGPSGCC